MFVGLVQALNCSGLSTEALAKFKNDAMKRRNSHKKAQKGTERKPVRKSKIPKKVHKKGS
ncbi:MAG: hypothetical protein DRJ65_17355 [Acidobacteria bacterium]|nr:MAG: hypothetical protein DRJ65_17355 [Acidobacteriota bacterium]